MLVSTTSTGGRIYVYRAHADRTGGFDLAAPIVESVRLVRTAWTLPPSPRALVPPQQQRRPRAPARRHQQPRLRHVR